MNSKTRREMIKAIVTGAAYAAPTILTLTAPSHLVAQGPSGMMMMMMGGGMGMGMPTFAPNLAPPPGSVTPPPPPGGAG